MKKLIAALLAALLLLPLAALAEDGARDDGIPEDMLETVSTLGVLGAKNYMKDPSRGFIGGRFTETEIDALTFGGGYRLYEFLPALEQHGSTVKSSVRAADIWLFFLNDAKGPAVLSTAKREKNGSVSFGAVEDAANLSAALKLLEKLCKKEKQDFAPLIAPDIEGFIAAQDFGGTERIVTVPGEGKELDREYLRVLASDELPTYEEFRSELEKGLDTDPEATEDPEGGKSPQLAPHIDKKRRLARALIIGGACLAAVGAATVTAVLIKNQKRK